MSSRHDVEVRLYAFLDQHYHRAPHASLMGRSPGAVFAARERPADDLDEQQLKDALTVRERRRVRADTTVSVDGQDWELDQGFLAGRVVTVGRSLLDGAPWVEHEGQRLPLHRVDPKANAHRRRPPRRPGAPDEARVTPFDPAGALLERATGRRLGEVER
jgi:putative transposase